MSTTSVERVVHARRTEGERVVEQIVRYPREGRWYREHVPTGRRTRIASVHEAAAAALALEAAGGTILTGMPGGGQFEAKVAGGRGRAARGVRR